MKRFILINLLVICWVAARAGVTIDFDKIEHWAGSGQNQAALIIQFNDGKSNAAYVWGYKWDGKASGEDMLRAVARASRCLTPLIQYTGTMGSTLDGIGLTDGRSELCEHLIYDFEGAKNGSAFDFYNPNTSLGQDEVPGDAGGQMCQDAIARAETMGYIEHPINAFRYGYPSYDYDFWKLDEDTSEDVMHRWQAGWYKGYWSYWCGGRGDTTDNLSYSGLGMSSRQLVDGSIDMWNYCVDMIPQDPAAELDYSISDYNEEMSEPEPIVRPVDMNKVQFWAEHNDRASVARIGELSEPQSVVRPMNRGNARYVTASGEKSAVVVFQFNDGKGPENLVYGYTWNGGWDDNFETVLTNIAKADPRMNVVFEGSTVKITYDSDDDGKIDSAIDHTDVSNTWNFYANRVADNEFVKVPKGRWLNPAAVLIVSHQPADVNEVSLPYQLFRPATDSENIFTIPENMDYALADVSLTIPTFVQLPEGATYSTSVSGQKDSELTPIINRMSNKNLMVTVEFKNFEPKTGKVWLSCNYKKAGETKNTKVNTNELSLKAMAPVRPITAIHYETAEIATRLNHPVENALVYEPADATYTKMAYTTSDRTVATVNATTGVVSTTTKAGSAKITATYDYDKSLAASFDLTSSLVDLVTDVTFEGADADGVITLTPKEMTGLIPIFTPADPDINTLTIKLVDNGTSKDDYIATMYTVNIWDENNKVSRFNELSGHRVGECKLTVEAKDGSGFTKEFTVKVVEPEREPAIDYNEGTIMLNEEWFGHTNGGLNWYSPDYNIVYQAYERENPGMSFGCTSQYGIIYEGKLFVSSKQAADGGDPLPGGGRLVVADAATLKHIGSIDDIKYGDDTRSGDGRALCGVAPGKIYMGTHQGIYIIDTDKIEVIGKIGGASEGSSSDLYNGQIGDMVRAGEYVYALRQNTGVFVIDPTTDKIIHTIEDANVQGITQSADGNVWYATIDSNKQSNFVELAIDNYEEIGRVVVPAEIGTVTCGWGAWRTTQFTGDHTVNKIFFAPGSSISNGGAGKYYSYDIKSKEFKLIFDINGLEGHTPGFKQGAYGTIRYDYRSDEIIVGTTEFKASGHYRYNWTHFVDVSTGELNKTIELRPYYWFQSHPIFPDNYGPELTIEDISFNTPDDEPKTIDLSELANDADNNNANIRFFLDKATAADNESETASVAEVAVSGKTLTVKPLAYGEQFFNLNIESNGKVVTKTIKVTVILNTGIDGIFYRDGRIFCDGTTLSVVGYAGKQFAVYDLSGRKLAEFTADSDDYRARFEFRKGVYVLHGSNNVSYKFILK